MSKKEHPLIFIVEDNATFNKGLDYFLKKHGYQNVKMLASGEECLQHLFMKPDIIIQDYNLQGLNGISVMQRAHKRFPLIGFIFLSSIKQIEVAVEAIKAGAFDYIVKDETAFQRILPKIELIIEYQTIKRKRKTMFWIAGIGGTILLILFEILILYNS
jgi:DNA-binding NtrC family response regulator